MTTLFPNVDQRSLNIQANQIDLRPIPRSLKDTRLRLLTYTKSYRKQYPTRAYKRQKRMPDTNASDASYTPCSRNVKRVLHTLKTAYVE